MGKQRGKRSPPPSHPTRLENWAGIRPQRLREIDDLCARAWLPPGDDCAWYATALPEQETRGEA